MHTLLYISSPKKLPVAIVDLLGVAHIGTRVKYFMLASDHYTRHCWVIVFVILSVRPSLQKKERRFSCTTI